MRRCPVLINTGKTDAELRAMAARSLVDENAEGVIPRQQLIGNFITVALKKISDVTGNGFNMTFWPNEVML